MAGDLKVINLGFVNCYLFETEQGYVLVDTGMGNQRSRLAGALEEAGCKPGNLQLVLITHADADHIGSAEYLREAYGAKIAMHPLEAAAVAPGGGGTTNRKPRMDKVSPLFRLMLSLERLVPGLMRAPQLDPDFSVDEGFDLSPYGLDARVVHIPGHSSGSIGVLTAEGDLVCGDLLTNNRRVTTPIIDDLDAYQRSIARLKHMDLRRIYPGHGKPIDPGQF